MKKIYLFGLLLLPLLFLSCQPESSFDSTTYQGKAFRYFWGNAIEVDKFNFKLVVENQSDSLQKYQYYLADSAGNPLKLMMDIEVKDSILLMKVGDYKPDVQRRMVENKVFYMGKKQVTISKFKRTELDENKDDAVFIAKAYGVVNMLSYSQKNRVIYTILSDKTVENLFVEINRFLEKDTTNFYYQSQK